MEFHHYITELYSQNSFVRIKANQELCNGRRNLSVISVFSLCSHTPVLIDSFRARIVRVATMCILIRILYSRLLGNILPSIVLQVCTRFLSLFNQ